MKRSALALIAALPLLGQTALPPVNELVDKYVQAVGGKAAIEKVKTRVSKGKFEIPAMGVTGVYTGNAKAPNKVLHTTVVDGYGTVMSGYDGKNGWESDPERGLNDLTGLRLARVEREAEFYFDLKIAEIYPKMKVTGKEKLGERDVYVVEAVPVKTGPEKIFFDAETGLIARMDAPTETPDGSRSQTTVYLEDYRAVDGVKLPFTVRIDTPEISFLIKLTEVTHNVEIEDGKFVKPVK